MKVTARSYEKFPDTLRQRLCNWRRQTGPNPADRESVGVYGWTQSRICDSDLSGEPT